MREFKNMLSWKVALRCNRVEVGHGGGGGGGGYEEKYYFVFAMDVYRRPGITE